MHNLFFRFSKAFSVIVAIDSVNEESFIPLWLICIIHEHNIIYTGFNET